MQQAAPEILGAWELPAGTLYDLYGGVGFFSALLGGAMARTVLVEFDGAAVDWARRNLAGSESECIAADRWLDLGGAGCRKRDCRGDAQSPVRADGLFELLQVSLAPSPPAPEATGFSSSSQGEVRPTLPYATGG